MRIVEDCAKTLSPEDRSLSALHDSYIANHKSRIASDLDIARERVRQDSAVLEVGSVPLLFTAALSASNYNVTGIDIAPERYKTTIEKTGIAVIKCDIEREKLPFTDNSFDAIFFNELFEHLRINPIFTLSEVLRVMRPGGSLMLSSPNLRSLEGILNFLIRNRAFSCSGNTYAEYQKLERLGHMGHVREYTTREVIEFLENVGFVVVTVIYRGGFNAGVKQLMARLFPGLRPFVSYVAEKPRQ
ncbi:MAG: class I SAM-dependent methyltransferase [Nitrospiraceae bacterium]|nr:class I SAM-dependent methyltransferase [Nitrospiraceae bacterium]